MCAGSGIGRPGYLMQAPQLATVRNSIGMRLFELLPVRLGAGRS